MFLGHAINLIGLHMFAITVLRKKLCVKDKYIYSAKHADAAVSRRRSESRKGVRITDVQKAEMDDLITKLVKKGTAFNAYLRRA